MSTETWSVEYTDTFSGEANYAWVRRATIHAPKGASKRTVTRLAKAAMGLTGMRGRSDWYANEELTFNPYGVCAVMFAQFVGDAEDSGHE